MKNKALYPTTISNTVLDMYKKNVIVIEEVGAKTALVTTLHRTSKLSTFLQYCSCHRNHTVQPKHCSCNSSRVSTQTLPSDLKFQEIPITSAGDKNSSLSLCGLKDKKAGGGGGGGGQTRLVIDSLYRKTCSGTFCNIKEKILL